jgi:hypothetical protein
MSLRRSSKVVTALLLGSVALAGSVSLRAQDPAKPPIKPSIPLKVDVVISRFQADKKVGSAPFTLWVNAGDPRARQNYVSIRMGMDVPVGTRSETRQPSNSSTTTTVQGPEYRGVGTQIDCMALLTDDNRFSVEIRVSDTSIYTGGDERAPLKLVDPLAFRSFTMNNTLTVRAGQTMEYSTATDRITGEVVKVEVTVNVVK